MARGDGLQEEVLGDTDNRYLVLQNITGVCSGHGSSSTLVPHQALDLRAQDDVFEKEKIWFRLSVASVCAAHGRGRRAPAALS
jgi:hypothetical protein